MKMHEAWVLEEYWCTGTEFPPHRLFGSYEEAMTAWQMLNQTGRVLQLTSWLAEQRETQKRQTLIEYFKEQREHLRYKHNIYENIY